MLESEPHFFEKFSDKSMYNLNIFSNFAYENFYFIFREYQEVVY